MLYDCEPWACLKLIIESSSERWYGLLCQIWKHYVKLHKCV